MIFIFCARLRVPILLKKVTGLGGRLPFCGCTDGIVTNIDIREAPPRFTKAYLHGMSKSSFCTV